jgi:hypothetical protein
VERETWVREGEARRAAAPQPGGEEA